MKKVVLAVLMVSLALSVIPVFAETSTDVPEIYVNNVPVVFLNKDDSVIAPTIIDGEVYVPLTSLLDTLQMSYVKDENSIRISTSGTISESTLPVSSGIKLDDFQAMVKEDTTYDECEFTQIESEEGNAYGYPIDEDYGITIFMDEQEMITRVVFKMTFGYEDNVPYLNSMNDYEFFNAMSNLYTFPIKHYSVLTFINNSASLLMYITGNTDDNPYSKVLDSNGEIVTENNWEYTLITNEEEQTAKFEFNYVGE